MGLDAHALHLLNFSYKKHGPLGRAVTLGRQGVHLGPKAFRTWVGNDEPGEIYCEALLAEHFGATVVDAIDNSPYEGARIVADMNKPLPNALHQQYDTVIDLGCLEHIFDVAQSLRNVKSLCREGGRILHLLPANGFCGHGFYQFSPELFFSYYTTESGFADTEVFFADLLDTKHWYRVHRPKSGQRINVRSSHELYLAISTRRVSVQEAEVQQSDYVHAWSEQGEAKAAPARRFGPLSGLREKAAAHPGLAGILRWVDSMQADRVPHRLRGHRQLERVNAGTP
jgi:SAM-dependent methyltransferase